MAYTVGEVEVSVYPNAKEFNDRLAAQVGPQADRLGKQIGDTLAQQIAQGIRKGLGDFPSDNPAKDPAKRKGDEAAGAFGDAFKARIRAALSDLPKVNLTADSSDVDRALAAVRSEMESLHDARIGIDLSDTEALAKLDELKAKLAEIGASSDSARVKVDTASATAELVKFQAELDKIDGETATARVKVDDGGGLLSGSGGISSLTGALMTVAPAIVPIGAAAIAGGMALTSMAAAGVAGAGVLAIAFKGVGDAVKLLGQQQTQQAAADASAGAGASQRAQAVVSAQRQMQSAQMSLADAQRSAAQQQISDAQAVKSAQAAVGDAQRAAAQRELADAQAVASAQTALSDARRNAANQQLADAQAVVSAQQTLARADDQVTLAQKALTDAQEAGRRELESFANNAADAALAQQQAAITLEQTQQAAAKTMASSTATDLQKRQAALDVAKAQQSLTEANQRVTESAKDNTQAQAAGVAGTQAVVSAQKQVTTAQDAQQKASQGLADAQRKAANDQITSQESIGKAAQSLTDAQRKAADDQVTSRENIAKAAQALTTAERKAADDQISSHESIVRAQQGVAAAADAMAAAQRQSSGTTNAALAATNDAIAKLDPATRNFAEYLRGTWAPIWHNVQSAAAGGLLPGVQAGMDALIPVMPQVTGIVGALAKAMGDLFAEAGRALGSPFWHNFLDLIQRTAGPLLSDLGHIIGNVVTGFAGIVAAFMPLTLQIGGGIDGLSQKFAAWGQNLASSQGFHDFVDYVHAEWPVIKQIIENVGTAIGHLIQAGGILGGPTLEILRTLSGILANLPVGVVTALVAAFSGFKVVQTVAGPIQSVTKSLTDMGTKLEGKDGLLGKLSGGLTGAAKAAGPAAGAIGFVAIAAQEWVQAGKAADDVAVALGRAFEEGGTQANEASAYIQKFAGVASLMDHSLGLADVKVFGTSLRDLVPSAQGATKAYQDWYNTLSPSQKVTEDVSVAQQRVNDAVAQYGKNSPQAVQAAADYQGALGRQKVVQDGVNQALETHLQRLQEIANQELAASNSALAAQMAQLQYKDAVDRLNQGIADGTLKGNALKEAQLGLAQQAIQTAQAAAQHAAEQAKANGIVDTGNISNQAMLKSLQDNAKYLTGDAKAAVEAQIKILQNATVENYNTSDAVTKMGLNTIATYDANTVKVKSATDAQIKDLQNLGLSVTRLPDKTVIISADTDPARQKIAGFLTALGGLPIVGGFAGVAGAVAQILAPHATGGIDLTGATGMPSSVAQVVPPGTLRLIGDNPVSDEAFIPINNNPRSHAILDQTAARMGKAVVPMAVGGITTPTYVAQAAPEYLDGLRAAASETSGPPIAAGLGGTTWPQLDAIRKLLFPGSVLTSAYRPGANDYHGAGEAIDIGVPGNSQAGLMPIAARLAQLYPGSTELIHNPNGSIKNGHPVAPSFWGPATWAQHANHVHWAMTPQAAAATRIAPAGLALGATGLGGGLAKTVAQSIVQSMAAARGWGSGAEWNALAALVNRESGWNMYAANPVSSARGLFQKMTSINGPVESTVQGQANWGLNYIAGRYGDPLRAWAHETTAGWYDQGGLVPPGYHMLYNGTGGNEVIAPQQTFREVVNQMHADAPGGDLTGLQISGRLELGADGFVNLVDGRIDHAFGQVADSLHHAGV